MEKDIVVCDCHNENWVFDSSGVDMYCKVCANKNKTS